MIINFEIGDIQIDNTYVHLFFFPALVSDFLVFGSFHFAHQNNVRADQFPSKMIKENLKPNFSINNVKSLQNNFQSTNI